MSMPEENNGETSSLRPYPRAVSKEFFDIFFSRFLSLCLWSGATVANQSNAVCRLFIVFRNRKNHKK